MHTNTVIDIHNLCFQYDTTPALCGVSCSIYQGQFVAIVGGNGSGKTTFLKSILGLIEAQGSLEIHGTIGYVPQKLATDLDRFPGTVRELFIAREVHSNDLASLLKEHQIDTYADRLIGSLSGGERQRVLVALALANSPSILVLDEPTTGIDVGGRKTFIDELKRQAQDRSLTVLYVTHHLGEVLEIADRVIEIAQGIVFDGTVAEYEATHHIH